jgi:outer membrane protein assembly factor BamB
MPRRTVSLVLGLSILLSAGTSGFVADRKEPAKDWPQWRGPKRDAASDEKGLLQSWGKEGPPLAWQKAGLGEGLASIVISNGRIFTMGRRDGGEFLIALSADDGKELWRTKVGLKSPESPSSTPTVDGDRVYALGPNGDLVCAESASGKELWRKSYMTDFGGELPAWKFCESPLVDGDKLICTPGSREATLVALDKKTGALIWKASAPNGGGNGGYGYSSPVVSEAAGVRQYVQLLGANAGCVGVAAADGRLLWKYERVSNGTASIPTPIVDGDYVFCSSGYGVGAALLHLQKDGDGVRADEVYFLPGNKFQNHHGGMIRLGEHIFTGHGHNNGLPMCLEMRTGKIVWGGDKRGPGTGSAAVVYADGQLYFRYENGLMALIGATPEGYKLNGTFQIPRNSGPSWSHPVVVGKKLYLREQDNLFVYNLARG